jgi:hypothetical protein
MEQKEYNLKGTMTFRHQKKIVNGEKIHVYSSICDGRPTKYITKYKWDYKLSFCVINGEMIYLDGNKQEVLVYEDDEPEYDLF